jgi:hypothetical protein
VPAEVGIDPLYRRCHRMRWATLGNFAEGWKDRIEREFPGRAKDSEGFRVPDKAEVRFKSMWAQASYGATSNRASE